MALGTDHVTAARAGTFIPEIWSDEIIASYKKNLVAANLFKKMSFTGKKGDTGPCHPLPDEKSRTEVWR